LCCPNRIPGIAKETQAVASRPHLDLDNYLPYLINRVGSAIAGIYTSDTLVPLGVSIDMWRVLAALTNNGEQRQIDLVDMTSIDASTMSRLVTRMVRQGLVTRTRSKTSSREVVVALSAKGRAQVEGLIPIAKKLEVTAVDGLPPKDLAVVKRALRRMYVNLTNGRRKTR
jgi:DNA-binding MarR family transcriptional regulator